MGISDILVYVDPTASSAERLDIAFRLAHRFEAYLIGVVPEDAAAVGERFEKMLLNEAILGEWHMAIGLTEPFVTRWAHCSDLVILGQRIPDHDTGLYRPEDVILSCSRPVLGDDFTGEDIVAGQPIFAHQPTGAAAERQACNARLGDNAGRDRQAMRMCFAIHIAKERSRLHAHRMQLRVNGNPVHRRDVDDNAIIAQGPAGDVVAAAFDRDEKIVRTRKLHGANDVGRFPTAGDQARMLVDARIPNTPS